MGAHYQAALQGSATSCITTGLAGADLITTATLATALRHQRAHALQPMMPAAPPNAAGITLWQRLRNFPLWLLSSRPLLPFFHEAVELDKHARACLLWR